MEQREPMDPRPLRRAARPTGQRRAAPHRLYRRRADHGLARAVPAVAVTPPAPQAVSPTGTSDNSSQPAGRDKGPFGNLAWLFERTDKFGEHTQRLWLLMASLTALTGMYAYKQRLTQDAFSSVQVGGVRVGRDLFIVILPIIMIYIFIQAGFLLGGYLSIRYEFEQECQRACPANMAAYEPNYRNYTIFYALFALIYGRVRPRKTRAMVEFLTFFTLALAIGVVPGANYALAVYLFTRIEDVYGSVRDAAVVTLALALMIVFYGYFVLHVFNTFKSSGRRRCWIFLPLLTTIATYILVLRSDPLNRSRDASDASQSADIALSISVVLTTSTESTCDRYVFADRQFQTMVK